MSEFIKYVPLNPSVIPSLPSIICLGNFDGVHLGHKALIDKAIEIKSKLFQNNINIRIGALCFNALPSDVLGGDVEHLMTLEQKLNAFSEYGLDFAYVCDFLKIKDLSPNEFIEKILWEACGSIGVICGFNFKFGKNAAGSPALLKSRFVERFGNSTCFTEIPPIEYKSVVISSSYIRNLVKSGQIDCANAMLGRPFSISHNVVHGKHLGTSLGFPTVNHRFGHREIIPDLGVYATKTKVDGRLYYSVTNIGKRPTVSKSEAITCETYIININEDQKDLYERNVNILFYKKLREEKRFDSFESLSYAIQTDVSNTINYFNKADSKKDIE